MKTKIGVVPGKPYSLVAWQTGLIFLLVSSLISMQLAAQGDRNGQQRTKGQEAGMVRQPIDRPSSIRQQSPRMERQRPALESHPANHMGNITRTPASQPGNTSNLYNQGNGRRYNSDRNSARLYNGTATRPANNSFNRSVNSNRLNNNAYNRPGNKINHGGNNYSRGNMYNSRRNNNFNNYRRPVYSAYNPNWRYAYAPRRNSIFNSLPSTYSNINFGGFGYRYFDGIYYRPYNNIFRVVAPPVGLFINTMPLGYRRIYVNNYPYYYYNGTYYDHRDKNYTVVSPPVGAVVESIPDGYETITLNGETYYLVDGAQYKPVAQENGEIWYEVIKAN